MGKGMSVEEHLWLSTLYMAWYNIGSAWVAFNNCDVLKLPPVWTAKIPVGTQRRNLRGGRVLQHLEDFIRQAKKAGSIRKLLTARFFGNVADDWGALTHNVGSVWGNGRWSTYTASELYQKVNRLPVLPTDIMNEGSSGPRTGLCFMHGVETPHGVKVVPKLDTLARRFYHTVKPYIETKIPYLPKGHYDLGMVESQLCDFNSLRKGRYYIGRDIDRDQDRVRSTHMSLARMRLSHQIKHLDDVWEARAAVFDKKYLGEYSGWSGRTEYALRHYLRTGEVADHMEIRQRLGYL
jgi:hypothetical protein